ncbi:hypothetical protein ACFC0D_20220 [Streptomyces sp. NPDC056222]
MTDTATETSRVGLSVVIPAFKEPARIEATLEAVRDHLESADGVPPGSGT